MSYRQPLLFRRPTKPKAKPKAKGRATTRVPSTGYPPCTLASFLDPLLLPGGPDNPRYRWREDPTA